MVSQENLQAALKWIDKMLKRDNQFEIQITPGVTINDLHKFLITKRERLQVYTGFNQKVVYLQTKLAKDAIESNK